MKSYKILPAIALVLSLFSCTDVVEIDVPEASPRLVVEASIDWENGTNGNNQTIKLSTSTPFFDTNTLDPVTTASVKVIQDATGATYNFQHQNNGLYTTAVFNPVVNQSYTLEITYNGENYTATETLMPVPAIDEIEQSTEGGFNQDAIDLTIYFNDPPEEENFYLIKYLTQGDLLPSLEDVSDEFTNGNRMLDIYEKEEDEDNNQEELMPGDVVEIALHGISEAYYNYIRILIEQSENNGNPFATTPVALKGNCINTSNPDNFAYGFFRLTQVDKAIFTIE